MTELLYRVTITIQQLFDYVNKKFTKFKIAWTMLIANRKIFYHERRLPWNKGKEVVVMETNKTVPIWEKSNLTLEEASAYSGIGVNKIRDLSNERNCSFVLFVGTKRLIKRRLFDEYIDRAYSI